MSELTDKEMLGWAAKAAGVDISCASWGGSLDGFYWVSDDQSNLIYWSPLRNDGDALRLAVKLLMRIKVDSYGAAARIGDSGQWFGCESHIYGGIESATRRAIVRAAAHLGKQM